MNNKLDLLLRIILVASMQFFIATSFAQISWPTGQLLPSFPATAHTQDLIYLNGTTPLIEKSWKWEAEGPSIGHKTGHLETDGWLCQVGIDTPNEHMVYGPYDQSVTAGPCVAEFRMKIDNNTSDNNPVVDIDVRNATTGEVLASQIVTRQQFTIASNYISFKLPFTMLAGNQSLELRVYWRGGAYIKVDYVGVKQDNSSAEMYLFASLKGIINRRQPRIFSYEGDAFAEGPYTWLQSLGMEWIEHIDRWEVLAKYLSEISGLIVYDPAQIHTVNLATVLAKDKKALIASPALLSRLTSAPYNLPILVDLRGQFTSKLQVYQTIYDTYWPNIDHRLLIGLSPEAHQASLREYATALGAAVIWLDPKVSGESELLNSFLSSMPAGSNFMGWWPEEDAGVTRASQYGVATVASDYAVNLTVHSGMPRVIKTKPMPPKPVLQNKIYVAFILSDGDNLQYVEHLMRKLWNNPDRGSVPMGWTLSPAMLDAMPGALNYYWQTSTDNDNLISGPSGYGYTYPNSFPNLALLNQYVAKTEEYNRRAGFRVVTVWNTITGGISLNVGNSYADNASTLLGVTAQNTGGGLTIYNSKLPGMALSCNYCTGEQAMKDAIASNSTGWNGAEPRFLIIQAQPWTDVKPTNFKNVASSLNSNYIVVRPDHIFQLIRESKGLTIDPGSSYVNPSTGLVTAYDDCNFSGFSAGLNIGDYNLAKLNSLRVKNDNMSSLKITEGYKATIYQDDNFSGGSKALTSDWNCFDETWNDKVTSIQVRANGKTGLNDIYFIQNRTSGLYVDVNGGPTATANGTAIIQSGFNGGTNQQFQLTDRGDGSYSIIAKHSGKCLDVIGISMNVGTKLNQWDYVGGGNQRFILVPADNGYYKLIVENTGLVAEVSTNNNGEQLHQWWNAGQLNSEWKLIPVVVNAVAQIETAENITIYPNPTTSQLILNSGELIIKNICITNTLGQSVFNSTCNQSNSTHRIDISQLTPNIYFLNLTTEAGDVITRKIIKQ